MQILSGSQRGIQSPSNWLPTTLVGTPLHLCPDPKRWRMEPSPNSRLHLHSPYQRRLRQAALPHRQHRETPTEWQLHARIPKSWRDYGNRQLGCGEQRRRLLHGRFFALFIRPQQRNLTPNGSFGRRIKKKKEIPPFPTKTPLFHLTGCPLGSPVRKQKAYFHIPCVRQGQKPCMWGGYFMIICCNISNVKYNKYAF